ncbi:hypothetical protein NFI96_030631, partial [Prochilodus magdalenae]
CTLENSELQLLLITAHTGGSVLLPCSCTDLQTKPEFSWRRPVGSTWVEMPINSDQYRNRVQLFNDHSPGNLSLVISHLTEEDGGDYECAVKGSHLIIRLTLEGCTLENREQLLTITAHTGGSVLLPCYCTDLQTTPEKLKWKRPVGKKWIEIHIKSCTLENSERLLTITAPTGGSVLLPCSCTDLQTKPENFTWTKRNRNPQTWQEISSEGGQYGNKVQLFNDHSPGNLSLLISHLTEEDGGVYQCGVKGSLMIIRLTIEEATQLNAKESCTPAQFTGKTADQAKAQPAVPTNRMRQRNPTSPTRPVCTTKFQEPPQSLPFVPFALVTVILLHIIVAVVYYTSRTKGCTLENSERLQTITAPTGGSVRLPCSCTDLQTKPATFTWKKYNTNRNEYEVISSESEPPQSLPFVPFALVTVILLHIIVAVVYYTSRTKGCTLVNSEQQLQHKRPLPITAHTRGSVLLPCSCTDLQTKPEEFRWKRANGNTWVEMAINSDQYRNRVQLINDHSPGNLSLLISHLTEEDGGVYQCAVKGSHISIRLTLEVCTLENRERLLTITAPTGGGPTYTFNCFISHCFISNCFISNYFISNCFISNCFIFNCFISHCFISNCFISNYFISNCFISNYFISNCFISNYFISNCFIFNCFISHCFISNCFISNCYISNCYIFNCFISNYFISNCYISNYFISNCFIFNCFISNYFISNCFIFNCSIFNCFIFNCFISCCH